MIYRSNSRIPSKEVPQANRLDLILKLVCDNKDWPVDASQIAKLLGYDKRQGAYYGSAASILGLLKKTKSGWTISDRGQGFCKLSKEQKQDVLLSFVVEVPSVSLLLKAVESSGVDGILPEELSRILSKSTDLDSTTMLRRVHSIIAWLIQVGLVCKFSDLPRVWHRLHAPNSTLLTQ